jgi:concentrative nucleoside transporter, CNT family
MLMTYALCGFSNFASIGIQIAGLGGMAPERQSDVARLGLRAMIAGMLATCMTACVAGVLKNQ